MGEFANMNRELLLTPNGKTTCVLQECVGWTVLEKGISLNAHKFIKMD